MEITNQMGDELFFVTIIFPESVPISFTRSSSSVNR